MTIISSLNSSFPISQEWHIPVNLGISSQNVVSLNENVGIEFRTEFIKITGNGLQANFKLKKAVPLNTSLKIECAIRSVQGMRCWVDGAVKDSTGAVTFASCEAQLVDVSQLLSG